MSKVTMIKKDAIVKIQVSTGFLEKVQKTMFWLISDKSLDQIAEFKKASEEFKNNNTEFPEPWMDALYTLSILIGEIENVLIKEGHTYQQEANDEDIITSNLK